MKMEIDTSSKLCMAFCTESQELLTLFEEYKLRAKTPRRKVFSYFCIGQDDVVQIQRRMSLRGAQRRSNLASPATNRGNTTRLLRSARNDTYHFDQYTFLFFLCVFASLREVLKKCKPLNEGCLKNYLRFIIFLAIIFTNTIINRFVR